jgi:putative aldouronate transport system permease protein
MKGGIAVEINPSVWSTIEKDFKRNKLIYLMAIPVIIYYLMFEYGPMYGLQIAFKNYSIGKGIWESPWIGFDHFINFFNNFYFWRLIRNTVLMSVYDLVFGFPAPIILALLLNEIHSSIFKRVVQSLSYLPHFISVVVVVGMMIDFLTRQGLVNQIIEFLGFPTAAFMTDSGWFRFLYVGSGIWQGIGWGSIIYLAALAGIDPSLYEASRVDGASRWKQVIHITIPGIMPTIIILFILRIGSMLSIGTEKILLMYNPSTYETADVISTYVYRKGILEADYGYTTAVGLFNAVISFILLILANTISKRLSDNKLW